MAVASENTGQSQIDKFEKAARDLETDDDPERFKERLGRLVKAGDKTPSPVKGTKR